MGSQAVAQFNDESFLQEDVVHLHRAYGLPRAKTVLVHGKRGRRDTSDTGGEGSLDLQTITSLAPEASTTWWGVDPMFLDGFMLAYTVDVTWHILGDRDRRLFPNVRSFELIVGFSCNPLKV